MTSLCRVWWRPDMIFMANTLPKVKLFLNDILCLKERSYLLSRPLAQNHTKQILRCNNQANELQLPRR